MTLSERERQLLTVVAALLAIYLAMQVAAALWVAIARVADVILIFVAAWAVSYLLTPAVKAIDVRTPLNRALSVVLVYVGIAIVLTGILALVVPGLVSQLNDLARRAPEYGDRASKTVTSVQDALDRLGIPVNLVDIYGSLPQRLGEVAGGVAADALGVASATATVLFDIVLVLIIGFLMLIDGDTMWNRFTRILSQELASEADLLRQSADRAFGGFLRGSLLLGLVYGAATLVILVALGVPFAGVLALISGLAMLIPFFGPIIAEVPVIAVTAFGAADRLLWVLALTLGLQQVVLNVIGPRVLSRSIGIHPILVFLALLLGSRLAGFWGVFLAMPIAGIANTFAQYGYEVARGRRTRAEAKTLIAEREAATAAAAAEARDHNWEAKAAR